jgi:hypothetical protein
MKPTTIPNAMARPPLITIAISESAQIQQSSIL